MILGAIGSLGAGCAGPLMTLLFGDSLNDFGSVEGGQVDYDTLTPEQQKEFDAAILGGFGDTMDKMVKKFLYIGVGMFCAEFLNNCMWNLAGLRQIFHLKEKYFATILKQEQGWFDSNNAFEFATKVQAQLEQIELGLGDKFALIL